MRPLVPFALAALLLPGCGGGVPLVRVSRAAEAREEAPSPAPPATASLFLRLVDERTGEPVRSEVQIWRLGVAGDDVWTEGDQLEATTYVRPEGDLVEDLPCGRYRIFALAQPRGSDDPPEFEVGAPGSSVLFRVPTPGVISVRLCVLDERGLPLTEGRVVGGSSSSSSFDEAPEWARPRERREPETWVPETCYELVGPACGCGGPGMPISADRDGTFGLGRIRCDRRGRESSSSWSVCFEGRTSVRAEVDGGGDPGETLLFGVSVPIGFLERLVLLPSGRPVRDRRLRVGGSCDAAPVPPAAVELDASLPRYESLSAKIVVACPEPVRLLRIPPVGYEVFLEPDDDSGSRR